MWEALTGVYYEVVKRNKKRDIVSGFRKVEETRIKKKILQKQDYGGPIIVKAPEGWKEEKEE